jgi:cephalosporin hydroxylase
MGRGRVIGIDIEIRPHNRAAIESHLMAPLITLIEGGSTDPATVAKAKALIRPGERVLVLLDSNHSHDHVAAELEAYASLVTVGSYIVATDGIMRDVAATPRGKPEWTWDNPANAAEEFAAGTRDFVIETPALPFDERATKAWFTHWPSAYLRRIGESPQ